MMSVRAQRAMGFVAISAVLLASRPASAETESERAARVAPAGQAVFTRPLGCNDPAHKFRCMAHVVTDESGVAARRPLGEAPAAGQFGGYTPLDLQSAYGLTGATAKGGAGKTVAIVDAYDWLTAESDLAAYRSQYGLPPCTTANGCFKKIAADGSGNLPAEDGQGANGWGGEIMLDLEMVSAVCPACNILLVEAADSADSAGFNAAPATAKAQGAVAISNSYGTNEDSSIASDTTFDLGPGILITASAGDAGFGASYPATSPFVIAVGGTNLKTDSSARGWAESVWAFSTKGGGTGSGCSKFIPQPKFQVGKLPANIDCTKRMESDLSAVADPQTGVLEVITDSGQLAAGVVGGTSASSPIIAAMMVRFGLDSVTTNPDGAGFPYAHSEAFHDVTGGGSNATTASATCGLQCTTADGYDGPTGWGTPSGERWLALGGGAPSGSGVDAGSNGAPSPGAADPSSGASSGSGDGSGAGSVAAPEGDAGAASRPTRNLAVGGAGEGGGCSTSGGSTSAGWLLALAALSFLGARRRQSRR